MNPIYFYLAAAVTCGVSLFLIKETTPYSRCGGSEYEKRQTKRLFAKLLFVIGLLFLGIALTAQAFWSSP